MQAYTFHRQYSYFQPTFTYRATDNVTGRTIGYVARAGKRWHASNKTWTAGGTLAGAFATRQDAANALDHLATGAAQPATYGGYVPETSCTACRALLFRDDGPRDRSEHLATDARVMMKVGPWKTSTGDAHCHYSDDGAHVPTAANQGTVTQP